MVSAYVYEDYDLFSESKGKLTYLGKPLSKAQIQESVSVLRKHRSPYVGDFYGTDLFTKTTDETKLERASLEAMIFAIANQGVSFETGCSTFNWIRRRAQGDVLNLRAEGSFLSEESMAQEVVDEESRYEHFFRYLDEKYDSRADRLAREYFWNADGTREKLVKEVNGIAAKTASFYSLMMGITDHMTLDIHNYRFLHRFGIEMPERLYKGREVRYEEGKEAMRYPAALPLFNGEELPVTEKINWTGTEEKLRGQRRKVSTKNAGDQPTYRQYLTIEKDSREIVGPLVRKYPEFVTAKGEIDYSLLTALFWTTGAKISRTKNSDLSQKEMFSSFIDSSHMFDPIEAVWFKEEAEE